MPGPLGRRPPTDDEHIRRYPLTVAALPPEPVPVALGINWYAAFDTPVWDKIGKRWMIGNDAHNLGSLRGGHCVCIKPSGMHDGYEWWRYYDQGQEGACVGFGISRMMTLLNRRRYDALWLYREAQKVDEWPGENYDGTSVRAGLDVLRERGHRRVWGEESWAARPIEGISENRWATSVAEILTCLQSPWYTQKGFVGILNSWGRSYPHLVYMPLETLHRLLQEDGEASIITDRIEE